MLGYRNIKEKLEKCGFEVTWSGPELLKGDFGYADSKSNQKLVLYLYYGYLHVTRK